MKKDLKKYRVMLRGQNYLILFDGKLQRHGFYTARFVTATNPEEAELRAVELVRQDSTLNDIVKNKHNDPPMIFLDEIDEIARIPKNINLGKGYTWYPEEQ